MIKITSMGLVQSGLWREKVVVPMPAEGNGIVIYRYLAFTIQTATPAGCIYHTPNAELADNTFCTFHCLLLNFLSSSLFVCLFLSSREHWINYKLTSILDIQCD